ncbi:hypothetical protein TB2_025943 [Malus domestica]
MTAMEKANKHNSMPKDKISARDFDESLLDFRDSELHMGSFIAAELGAQRPRLSKKLPSYAEFSNSIGISPVR